jgi:DNA-binding transcriptional regulator/RsmH inhibitor MraZ
MLTNPVTYRYRWFEGDIPPVFNAITGLKLKDGTIKKQFQDHLVLYGEKAFPNSFGKIFKSTPFADTKAYNDIRSIIESEAQKIGADLRRRLVEQVFSSGRAENARSEYTRQTYRTLVDRAAQMTLDEQLTTNLTSSLEEVTQGIQSSNETGGFLETEGHQILLPPAQSFHTGSSPGTPCLAFRVWDDHRYAPLLTHLDA